MELHEQPLSSAEEQQMPQASATDQESNAMQETSPEPCQEEAQAELTAEDEIQAVTAELSDEESVVADNVDVEMQQSPATKEQIIEKMRKLVEDDAPDVNAEDIARLKMQFYQIHADQQRQQLEEFVAAGNDAEAFASTPDPDEDRFKELMATLKEKKAEMRRHIEEEQQANLKRKREIIEQIIAMSTDADTVNRHFTAAKDLQTEFLAIGEVPDTEATAVWKDYQDAREKFYDQLKINKELRDYDFKKNLAEKQLLCREAESLVEEPDVITAFRRLQELHDKWRRIGPVAKELREEIWNKFKDSSAAINKRYQAHFEERKAREAENEAAKTAICEEVEALDFSSLKSYASWESMTRKIMDAQTRWKTIGFASRKTNNALFARFRALCDKFFAAKAEFFKSMKESLADNLARKTALCEQAEALKDSTDWRKTSDTLVELQKEWRTIGPVAKKHSDAVWQRFLAACDYFFEQKKKVTSGTRHTEQANLKLKQEIIDRLAAMTAPDAPAMDRDEAASLIADLRQQWGEIGHVPFKMKDKLYDSYRQLLREAESKFNVRSSGGGAQRMRRNAQFDAVLAEMDTDKQKAFRERERLVRACDQRRQELLTYNNNMGFLSFKPSKGGESPLLKEMERRKQSLQDDIADLEQKIRLLDEKLG